MILGRGSGCDDVVAEVFLALWLSPESFDPARGSLLGFLRLKAKGRSIDMVRSETARTRRESRDRHSLQKPDEGFDSIVIAAETTAVLLRAIESLETNERQPIELAFYQGMAYRTIGVYLGIPEGTIKSRIRSGLRHLREHIESSRPFENAASPTKIGEEHFNRGAADEAIRP
jgi:RNA polymerase sigma-70 factor (ECF subfamily)